MAQIPQRCSCACTTRGSLEQVNRQRDVYAFLPSDTQEFGNDVDTVHNSVSSALTWVQIHIMYVL
jgi:hypothetical protein